MPNPGLQQQPRAIMGGVQVQTADIAAQVVTGAKYADDSLRPGHLNRRYTFEEFETEPVTCRNTGVATAGATGNVNVMLFEETNFEYHIKGTQTIVRPNISASGLDIGMDQTASDGIEITQGITAISRSAFVVGTDAPFFLAVTLKPADASGSNPLLIGFRVASAYQADYNDYTDFAAIGIVGTSNPNLIKTATAIGDAATVTTDTTNTWADAAVKTLKVLVSAAGVVTYQINGSAPTTVAAYTFTGGLVLVPFLVHLQAADLDDNLYLQAWECGLQTP